MFNKLLPVQGSQVLPHSSHPNEKHQILYFLSECNIALFTMPSLKIKANPVHLTSELTTTAFVFAVASHLLMITANHTHK